LKNRFVIHGKNTLGKTGSIFQPEILKLSQFWRRLGLGFF